MLSVPGTWLSLSQVSAWNEIGGATFGQGADCWGVGVRGLYGWKFKSSSENFQLSSREFASPSWTSVLFSSFHTGLPGLCMGSRAGGNRTTSVCPLLLLQPWCVGQLTGLKPTGSEWSLVAKQRWRDIWSRIQADVTHHALGAFSWGETSHFLTRSALVSFWPAFLGGRAPRERE